MAASVLIKACLNGNRAVDGHAALPVTPEQLATAARSAVDAGAGAVHIHPRAADGSEASDPEAVAAAIIAVREAVPGLPVGVTTGLWVYGDVATRLERIRAWTVAPDFASVNWSEDGYDDLADLLISKGIGIEAGLSSVEETWTFATGPIAYSAVRALIEVRDRQLSPAADLAHHMDEALETAGNDLPRLHHGFGPSTWSVIEAAFKLGRDVRIGLQDTTVLPDGSEARDNAELVAKAVEIARAYGLEPLGLLD